MSSRKCRAARLFYRLEFHAFHARTVGIVQIQLPLAVAPELRLFAQFSAVLDEHSLCLLDRGHSQRDMIHDAYHALARAGRDIEHVLEPVRAVRYLHAHPICFVVFHAALPVEVKAEHIFVEVIFDPPVVHNKSRMDDAKTDLAFRLFDGPRSRLLDKTYDMAFGIW